MDRETRKANLKILQLPKTSGNKQQRKNLQTAKSSGTPNTAISSYFVTPEKQDQKEKTKGVGKHQDTLELKHNQVAIQSSDKNLNTCTRTKRRKLDDFIFKDPISIRDNVRIARKSLKDDDILVPEKKVKKAPKLSQGKSSKTSRAKRQTTIKSAFLRNEQLFAEIAAQHCAADQFDGDDVQLALAISKSEAEIKYTENVKVNEINSADINNEAELIRGKLKQYGFRTAEKEDYNTFAVAFLPKINNRRLKSKWANKFTSLTLRSSEKQMKKLQENIEKLLNNQFRTKQLSEHENILPDYKLISPLLQKLGVDENKRIFQTTKNDNQSSELFFVNELFEINQLPAGHLLKDWSCIQGRDLTPRPKNKKSIERIKILEDIYHNLEEFFSKRLDWSEINDNQKDQEVITKGVFINNEEIYKEDSPSAEAAAANLVMYSSKYVEKIENGKVDEIPELKNVVHNSESDIEMSLSASKCKNKILQLLPPLKSLDVMQVSSCSLNTQATINSTQKNRSKSPDLFADSDVEMEETDKTDENDKPEVETVIRVSPDKCKQSSLDGIDPEITTYEIFSSDEVKNAFSSTVDKSTIREMSPNKPPPQVIDLTQYEIKLSTSNDESNKNFNQIKSIEEIDIFAESPSQEDNDKEELNNNSEISNHLQDNENEESFKFTLSNLTNNKEESIIDKKQKESFELSPCRGNQEKLDDSAINKYDVDIVLREMAMDQSNTSFLNFRSSKQLETSFHRKTATVENDSITDNLTDSDSIFRKLCKKYLNQEPANTAIVSELQQPVNILSQNLSILRTPQKIDSVTNFTMDIDITENKNRSLQRKSLSFTARTPVKIDSNTILSKSQLLSTHHTNSAIDLTQSDVEDVADVEIEDEDDDDCLILSDDEINYSIWQADKTLNFQNSEQLNQQDDISLSSEDFSKNEDHEHKDNIIEFPSQHSDSNKPLPFLDLGDTNKSLIKIALGANESISDFEIVTSKYDASSNSPKRDEAKFDRSEFGILEEYSEPIDYTPNLCTPTKVLAESSFLSSPTETTAPMKLYSNCNRSSQKFQELINSIPAKSPPYDLDYFNDFDEFDRLVSISPVKSAKSKRKPQGIDQLLTAEISFKESQKSTEIKQNLPSKFVEKTVEEVRCNNKIYTVRYCFSPKPDYTKYSEAQLLKELYKFGIKPLKRKQAVKMLEYIYNQTHPIIVEDDQDTAEKKQDDVIILDDYERPCTSKSALEAKSHKNFMNTPNGNEKDIHLLEVACKKLNLQDSCGLEMLRYSNDLKPELSDESYIFQTNVTKKTARPLLPFHIAWYNLICSNRKLHEMILMYSPIDLQEVYLFFKALGYRYDPKDLKLFLDRRCIIFRYDITGAAGSNRHVRKSKKTKISNSQLF